MLTIGDVVTLAASRRSAVVRRFLGEGSQGTVFEVALGDRGDPAALKWYFPGPMVPTQRAAIAELVDRGSPDSRFLWPIELAERPGDPSFGYVMPLRPPAYAGLSDLLTGKVDVPFSTVCTLGIELAGSFLALHNEGLCYRDISFGNVFFDPATGRALICDNDNVGVDGRSTSAVLGTRRFMAPEIVRREAQPSTATDLYSLAVLLFYLLMVGHPLVGRRELEFPTWDDEAESVLFGREPRFVFDPGDASNTPMPELHAAVLSNWELYPSFVHRLFEQAFTTGLTDARNGRVRESVWRSALSRLRDLVLRCPTCGKESFWQGQEQATCWACRREIERPVRLEIDGRPLVLNEGTTVYRHHLALDYDFRQPVAQVMANPARPDRWGLRNESAASWQVTLPSGETTEAQPGRAVGLLPGTRLAIGGIAAQIVR